MNFGLSTLTRGVFTTRENYMAVATAAERAGFGFLSVSDHLIVPGSFNLSTPTRRVAFSGRLSTVTASTSSRRSPFSQVARRV